MRSQYLIAVHLRMCISLSRSHVLCFWSCSRLRRGLQQNVYHSRVHVLELRLCTWANCQPIVCQFSSLMTFILSQTVRKDLELLNFWNLPSPVHDQSYRSPTELQELACAMAGHNEFTGRNARCLPSQYQLQPEAEPSVDRRQHQ